MLKVINPSPRLVILALVSGLLVGSLPSQTLALVVDFEELAFAEGSSYHNQSPFDSQGVVFSNTVTDWGGGFYSWEGFAYSRETQVPPLDTDNQLWVYEHTAFPGGGADGSENYAIAFDVARMELPSGAQPISLAVTNNVYAALTVRNGNDFAKKFGGANGDDPDWFRLRVTGFDVDEQETGEVEFYLADFRGTEDYIVDEWVTLDLTPLGAARYLDFSFDSSDNDPMFGMNTPAYAAIDNLVLSVPTLGDYNGDGVVDAADYTVWRNTLGSTDDLRADGDNSGVVDAEDFQVWKGAFGTGASAPALQSVALPSVAVPEPSTVLLLAGAMALLAHTVRRGR